MNRIVAEAFKNSIPVSAAPLSVRWEKTTSQGGLESERATVKIGKNTEYAIQVWYRGDRKKDYAYYVQTRTIFGPHLGSNWLRPIEGDGFPNAESAKKAALSRLPKKDPTIASIHAKKRSLEDTVYMPIAVSDSVISQIIDYLHEHAPELESKDGEKLFADRDRIGDEVDRQANKLYQSDKKFAQKIDNENYDARPLLYSFVQHWVASIIKKSYPEVFKVLPKDFAMGKPLIKRSWDASVHAKKDKPKGTKDNPWDSATRAEEGPTKPTKPSEPEKPSKPSEPKKPTKTTKPTEPTKPGTAKGEETCADPFKRLLQELPG